MPDTKRFIALADHELKRLLNEFDESLLVAQKKHEKDLNLFLSQKAPAFLRLLHSIKSILHTVYGRNLAQEAHDLESFWSTTKNWLGFVDKANKFSKGLAKLFENSSSIHINNFEKETSDSSGSNQDQAELSFFRPIPRLSNTAMEKISQLNQRGKELWLFSAWIAKDEMFKVLRVRMVLNILQKKLWIGSACVFFVASSGEKRSLMLDISDDSLQVFESEDAVLLQCLAIGDYSRQQVIGATSIDNVFLQKVERLDFATMFAQRDTEKTIQALSLLMRKYAPTSGINPEHAFVSFSMEWRSMAMTINSLKKDYSSDFVEAVQRIIESLNEEHQDSVESYLDWSACKLSEFGCGLLIEVFLHLARNVFSHACQPAEVRKALKKTQRLKLGISLYIDKADIVLSITDDGKGIDDLAVLENESDNNPSEASLHAGRNLGLLTVKHIIQNRLHGTIECLSQLDLGSKFIVRIPRHASQLEMRFLDTPNGLVAIPEVLVLEELSQIDQFRFSNNHWIYGSRSLPILSGIPENQSTNRKAYLLHIDGIAQAIVFAQKIHFCESCLLPFEGTSVYTERLEQWVEVLELPS